MVTILIRYNEIGLKSPRVRKRFQNQMIKNIEDKFLRANLDCFIDSDWGRIYLHTDESKRGIELLRGVFGITSVSPVISTSDGLEDITKTVLEYSQELLTKGRTFALRTRRTGTHDYTSMTLAEHVGKEILEHYQDRHLKVNLTRPDIEIFIEVRNNQAYIFSESYSGPGGLPLGTQGKIISIISDLRSYLASWLMMKRGCRVYPVFFKSPKDLTTITEDQAHAQVEILQYWADNMNLEVIPAKTAERNYFENKQFLKFIQRIKAKGICLSFDLTQFIDQSKVVNLDLPVFYPLIGLDSEMLQKLEMMINAPAKSGCFI